MKRREFISLLGGATAWPLTARAQQADRVRRIGVLLPATADDAEVQARVGAFLQGLQQAGWTIGRNVRIDTRWATTDAVEIRRHAAELAALAPDVILAHGASTVGPLLQATRSVPIVFPVCSDPVGVGLVASLARPGGNATGVHQFNTALGTKQLGLLRDLIPSGARVGLLVNPNNSNAAETMTREVTEAAATMGVEIGVVRARDRSEIGAAFATLVRNRADALVVGADSFFLGRRLQLATLATRHAIPAVYNAREFPEAGGLMSYGASLAEVFRYLGAYTASILKGDKPADLPVVQSTKLELVLNHETARILGLTVPDQLLALADEVIE